MFNNYTFTSTLGDRLQMYLSKEKGGGQYGHQLNNTVINALKGVTSSPSIRRMFVQSADAQNTTDLQIIKVVTVSFRI